MVSSYELYSQAEILLDVTLEELLRTEHASREHDKTSGRLIGGANDCIWFPCRMIRARREEADDLIRRRAEVDLPRLRKGVMDALDVADLNHMVTVE